MPVFGQFNALQKGKIGVRSSSKNREGDKGSKTIFEEEEKKQSSKPSQIKAKLSIPKPNN
jgi:hypothetical protein